MTQRERMLAGLPYDPADPELAAAMARHPAVFSAFYVAMIRVGEMTGRLDDVFMRLFKHLEFEQFMRQQVKSALRYPVFVMAAMAAAIADISRQMSAAGVPR